MKLLIALIFTVCLSQYDVVYAQNYNISRVQIKDPNSGTWADLMTFSKLNLFIDDNKSIVFYDYNMRLMEILAGKSYVTQYNNISFVNKGFESSDEAQGVYGYVGNMKLDGGNNFAISADAYVSFMYQPGTKKLGLLEVRNKFCMCYVRLWVN